MKAATHCNRVKTSLTSTVSKLTLSASYKSSALSWIYMNEVVSGRHFEMEGSCEGKKKEMLKHS